jgi:hypothetical protein
MKRGSSLEDRGGPLAAGKGGHRRASHERYKAGQACQPMLRQPPKSRTRAGKQAWHASLLEHVAFSAHARRNLLRPLHLPSVIAAKGLRRRRTGSSCC